MSDGIKGFIEALSERGLNPRQEDDLVLYEVMPETGAHAQMAVETGVSVIELEQWPHAPPHWIHLPAGIRFPNTNTQASPKAGWLMHSRNILGWGDTPPATRWTTHVRGVLGEAIE